MVGLLQQAFFFGHVDHEIDHAVGIAPFIVVPGNDFEEVGIEFDTGAGVEDGAAGVADEIAGDDLLIRVAEEALEIA